MSASRLTRRQALRRGAGLGAAAMLGSGLWPGWAAADEAPASEDFTFLCVNDLHFFDRKCVPFFEQMVRQMKQTAGKPPFCLIVGDLAEDGTAEQQGMMRDLLKTLEMPYYVVVGNHDHLPDGSRKAYEQLYPKSINYGFDHKGWQFVALDTTDGRAATNTTVHASTIDWLTSYLPRLDKKRPTVLFTHFPLGGWVFGRPKNADAVLEPFKEFNLQAVFNGHFHGFTERHRGSATLTTDKCCSFHHKNHDGTKEKGYFVCEAKGGKVQRRFVEVKLVP